MSALAEIIYKRLTTDVTTFAALSTRIYPFPAPEDAAAPYVVFEEFDGERESVMGEDLDIVRAVVRVNLLHTDHDLGGTVREQIRAALQRFRGTAGTVTVDDIFIVPGSPVTYDEQKKAWNFQRDYEVIYRE